MTQNTSLSEGAARTPSAIDALAEQYVTDYLALHPDTATELGFAGHESEYSDFSPAGARADDELNARLLADLEALEPADEADRVTKAAMQERIGLEREIHATGRTELNNIASPAQGIRAVFDLMPTDTAEHWEHIAGRLENLPAALAGYTASLIASKDSGHVAAQRQIDIVIEQARAHGTGDGFFPGLTARAQEADVVDAALAERIRSGAEAGAQAYRDFADALESELRPHAPEADAVGIEHYRLASRVFLGAEIDLEETYRWGQQELARLIAAQEADAERIKPGATIEEARAVLDADPERALKGTGALRAWMQRLSDEAVAAMKEHFEIPAPMDRLECMIAPTQEGGIYYTGPSDDFSRPGRMWWSVPAGEDEFTTWAETTTVYHEGVPGHHLQVATAMMNRANLNLWRRSFCWTSGHGEGWALYAERLMEELGFLDDPGDHLGMLDMQRMRAARVVFDIGYHCGFEMPESEGGGAWDPERGYAFLAKHLNISDGQRRFEFTRYLGWPGQAPAYKVGQRIWEQIRAEHEEREGADFDLRAFHTRALKLGSMGLDTLRDALA
ncbi:DUF885 domain-containing protein [Micrococcus sp. EYE_162]|uniref:DUF885 domain-containing protein n=1 Tax=unclassified Micrococcus TaxID=2620948 RepID=UPI002003F093|nr:MULTISPECIES: DUF885 domain-containing protein [unclassified Micrococcus]MCK6096213.1 DUF885 domain-containing protein [Micrococcus sp. EYE_212]MCK6171857.1 DUF885 domain-containing protein [Micrococcus sp. EYE_162]